MLVTGLGLTSEWAADLQIAGSPTNPAITGRADLVRGDYEFAGPRVRARARRDPLLRRGAGQSGARYRGECGHDRAERVDPGDRHRAEAGDRLLQRRPRCPQDELLSRLLFGTSITNLSAPEALQLAAAVAALQGGGSGLNPINAVRRAAGLDRLRILPADPQTGQGTSIAAGKYVTRRLYAEIVTDGQGYSATRRRVPGDALAVDPVEHLDARPAERERAGQPRLLTRGRFAACRRRW